MPARLTIWDLADSYGNVTVSDVATVYNVDVRTVNKWLDGNLLPYRKIPSGRRIIIKADDVDWFDSHHMRPRAESTSI